MSFENVQPDDCRSHRRVQSTCKLQKTCVFHAEPIRKAEREVTRLVRRTARFRQNCLICAPDTFGGSRVLDRLSGCGGGICSRRGVNPCVWLRPCSRWTRTAVGTDSRCHGVLVIALVPVALML